MGKNKKLILGLMVGLLITLLVFISGCAGLIPEGTEEGGFDWTWIVFLVAIFAVFYFLLIRPQQKKQKEHEHLIEDLQKGDNVITAGGIFGRIESINDDNVVIKVESGATIRVARSSVATKRFK